MPFAWKTPIGYTITMCTQICIALATCEVIMCLALIYILFCSLFDNFALDLIESFRFWSNNIIALDENLEHEKSLRNIIQFHVETKK